MLLLLFMLLRKSVLCRSWSEAMAAVKTSAEENSDGEIGDNDPFLPELPNHFLLFIVFLRLKSAHFWQSWRNWRWGLPLPISPIVLAGCLQTIQTIL